MLEDVRMRHDTSNARYVKPHNVSSVIATRGGQVDTANSHTGGIIPTTTKQA